MINRIVLVIGLLLAGATYSVAQDVYINKVVDEMSDKTYYLTSRYLIANNTDATITLLELPYSMDNE